MTINSDLMNAILAMDSYNRGYGRGMVVEGTKVGNYSIGVDSSIWGGDTDSDVSFFAQAYTLDGHTIISYRGTDDYLLDPGYGWALGAGDPNAAQALLAAAFYRYINDGGYDSNADISLTGHSLGGGLAGFVGTI